jgi:hypothetical protein
MNNNYDFQIDNKQVLDMFSEFDKKLRKKTFVTVLRKSANVLRKQTISNLKQVVKNIDTKDRYGNSFRKGIKISIAKDSQSAKVHILGFWMLKFFEMGTVQRFSKKWKGKKLRKERYTGKIKRYEFFKRAKEQTEQQIFSLINENLINTIKKINDKYKNK